MFKQYNLYYSNIAFESRVEFTRRDLIRAHEEKINTKLTWAQTTIMAQKLEPQHIFTRVFLTLMTQIETTTYFDNSFPHFEFSLFLTTTNTPLHG